MCLTHSTYKVGVFGGSSATPIEGIYSCWNVSYQTNLWHKMDARRCVHKCLKPPFVLRTCNLLEWRWFSPLPCLFHPTALNYISAWCFFSGFKSDGRDKHTHNLWFPTSFLLSKFSAPEHRKYLMAVYRPYIVSPLKLYSVICSSKKNKMVDG